ncbi:unnamed protein product [Prunus armeniaca]|uniref:Uncharacterized protein n=1 Tax=Prunus armeniaca TaxID=36596 RepID=A0A6J5WKT4_PRUAR|nr:unnamed protein product [Prunus armeniaca]
MSPGPYLGPSHSYEKDTWFTFGAVCGNTSLQIEAASPHPSKHRHERNQAMLGNQHLRKKAFSSTARRNAHRRRKERLRSDHLKSLEEKMSQILKGVKDVKNLSNSLRVQNEILQENQAKQEDQVHVQQELEPTRTKDTDRALSSSTVVETPRRRVADARNTLVEKKAWQEHNKRLMEDLHKGKNQIDLKEEEEEEEVDGITSKLRDLVGSARASREI